MNSKGRLLKRVSLILALSLIVSNFYFNNSKVMADTTYPYIVSRDSNNFQKPNTYTGQVIMADEYVDTPGWTARAGYNETAGWKFYQTVMFPQDATTTDSYMKNNYDGSITGAQAMANANYGVDSNDSDDQDSHYYLNYKFASTGSDEATYNYPYLIYYRAITMYLKDPVRIGYKIDSNSFTPASGGAVMWQTFPNYGDYDAKSKFIHDYHIATIAANPQHTAPTTDFYFNSGDSTETVSSGQTLNVTDGTTSSSYSDTSSLFWSTYYTMSNSVAKHGSNHSLPQSYTYDDAVITGSSWSITNSSGANVNSLFSPQLNNKSATNAASGMTLTVDSNVPAGTYTVHHKVADNWGSSSGDQTKTFTVTDVKQNYLTVHYIDKDSGTDIQDVDNQISPYTPQAPSGYSLTGSYRTSVNDTDTAYNGRISVDLSTSSKEIYVMCQQLENSYTLNLQYIDEDTGNPIYNTAGCPSTKLYVNSDLTDYGNSKIGYYLPTVAPSGYQLDTSKYFASFLGYGIGFDTDSSLLPKNGFGSGSTADLQIYCRKIPPVPQTGTVIKRYFVDGIEQTADESEIDNVDVGPHTYSPDKSYPRHTCSNPTVTVNVISNSTVYADFNFGLVNHPPTVTLQGPSEVVMGDDFSVNASGVDPDGDSLTYSWNVPSDLKGSASGYTASGYFDNTGNKNYSVTVTDSYGASASATTVVKVVPPVPNVVINKSGNEKENRKVTLDVDKYSSSGSNSGRYPLDWSKVKWQFFDGSGNELTVDNNPTSSTIVKSLDSTTASKSMDLIFKKAGKYTAKCTLYNTAGYSNSFSVDLNIVPDLSPTANLDLDSDTGYRDPKDLSPNGLAQGTTVLTDNSTSSDDNISKRMWIACFDSDNDGSYINITNNEDGTKKTTPEKERWYVYDLDYNGDSDTRYKIQVPDSTPLNGKLVTIGSDGHKYAYVNDSLNPHWRYVGSYDDVLKLDINKINCGNLKSVTFKSTSVGKFDFEKVVQESFGQETIPQLITNSDIKQANTFGSVH
ncbi:PKD domain-containing protein [Clostridium guangxiense]|uniref:PKD domain-containing protein n=1 Tax=Clostridium guangxiense TaxID=1662055 RepID=UPI001E658C26|nr:PKD domain-containing protein [Clostridium guangxiense]